MSLTLNELKERLCQEYDEITLVENLNISAEDICDAFEDRIMEKFESLAKSLEEDDE